MNYLQEAETCTAREALEIAGINPDSLRSIGSVDHVRVPRKIAELLVNGPESHENNLGRPFVVAGGHVLRQWPTLSKSNGGYFRLRFGLALILKTDEQGVYFDVGLVG